MLISPGRLVGDRVTEPPFGLPRVLRKESHAWIACDLVSLLVTALMMLVMFMMLLMFASLLSERHWNVVVERKVVNVLFLIGKAWIFGIGPALLARVLVVRVVQLGSFGLGEALQSTWHESDSWEPVALRSFSHPDSLGTAKQSNKADGLL